MEMNKDGTVSIVHDGYVFIITLKNYHDKEYQTIGHYVDNAGYMQVINRYSVYGSLVSRMI